MGAPQFFSSRMQLFTTIRPGTSSLGQTILVCYQLCSCIDVRPELSAHPRNTAVLQIKELCKDTLAKVHWRRVWVGWGVIGTATSVSRNGGVSYVMHF